MRYAGTTERLPVGLDSEERGSQPLAPGTRSRTLVAPARLHIRIGR